MKPAWALLLLAATLPIFAGEKTWPPEKDLSEMSLDELKTMMEKLKAPQTLKTS